MVQNNALHVLLDYGYELPFFIPPFKSDHSFNKLDILNTMMICTLLIIFYVYSKRMLVHTLVHTSTCLMLKNIGTKLNNWS